MNEGEVKNEEPQVEARLFKEAFKENPLLSGELLPIDKERKKSLIDLIGEEAVELMEEKGTAIRYITQGHDPLGFVFEHGKRIVFIRPGVSWRTGERRQGVNVDFAFTKDVLGKKAKIEAKVSGKIGASYLKAGKELDPETGKFLRFIRDFVYSIRDDCDVILTPSSHKRWRIYNRYFSKHPKKNIFLVEASPREEEVAKTEPVLY